MPPETTTNRTPVGLHPTTRLPVLPDVRPRVVRVEIITDVPKTKSSRNRARRGRRAVLGGILLFFATQAGLNLAIRNDWIPIRDPIYFEKFEVFQKRTTFFAPRPPSAPPRVMALGSSRTQLAFNPRVVEGICHRDGSPVDAFNFGCPAAGPMTCALYLRRMLEAGAKPDYVLVEIHPGFLTPLDPPYESRWLHGYRINPEELEMLHGFGWNAPTPSHHGWKGWMASSRAFRYALLNRYAPAMLPCPYGLTIGAKVAPDGYVRGMEVKATDKPRALERTHAEYAPTFPDYRTGGPGVEALRDILTRCRDNGIRAAVVLMPESSEYRSWYGPDGLQRVSELAATLSREFGVPAVDAREWVPDNGFADGHHLTARGAWIYTQRLTTEFVRTWVTDAAFREGQPPR